jgi:phosphoribosylformylglycinamidine cyclo-ligase
LQVDQTVEELGMTVGEALLTPTQIYAQALRQVLNRYTVKSVVHGIAHITGGGLRENIERILPSSVGLQIEEGSWPVPPVFSWLQKLGAIDNAEMESVFNMGIGLALIVSPYYAESIQRTLRECGLETWRVGCIETSTPKTSSDRSPT